MLYTLIQPQMLKIIAICVAQFARLLLKAYPKIKEKIFKCKSYLKNFDCN